MKRKGRRHLAKVRTAPALPPDVQAAVAAMNWFLRFPQWPLRRNGEPYPSPVLGKVGFRWAGFIAVVLAAAHLGHRRGARR